MSEARKKADWPTVAAIMLAVVLVPLALYVGAYFATCIQTKNYIASAQAYPTGDELRMQIRCYRYEWQTRIFKPVAKVESVLTQNLVVTKTGTFHDDD